MLYYLALEPMDKRYTAQWYEWFGEVLRQNGINVEYVDGKRVEFNVGSAFLDMKNTFVWKFSQLARLFEKKLKDGDIIFIPDGEFPGIEAIEYFRRFYNIDVVVVECWHAGTYDKMDLMATNGLGRIGKDLEEVWMDVADLIFVATDFHKEMILRERRVDEKKIKVTGYPVDVIGLHELYGGLEKKKRAMFTGRLSWEKGYDVVIDVRRRGFVEVVCSQENDWNKLKYYEELGKSRCVFSPARQETFGYGVVEGMAMNCIPVVPDDLSYREYVPKEWRYKNEDEMIEKLILAVNREDEEMWKNVLKYNYKNVIEKMIFEMENRFGEYLYS